MGIFGQCRKGPPPHHHAPSPEVPAATHARRTTLYDVGDSSKERKAKFYKMGDKYLCLRPDSDLAGFEGDAIITSTNRYLEGCYRKNWYGYAGLHSADAALHQQYMGRNPESALARHCRSKQKSIEFGQCLITRVKDCEVSNPQWQRLPMSRPAYSYIAHTVVPPHKAIQ